MPIKPRLENTNIIWKIFRCCGVLSKNGERSIPAAIKNANMASAMSPTRPIMPRETCPTDEAALEIISMGLNTLTIMAETWLLVWASIIPFFATKNPAPIMISSASI